MSTLLTLALSVAVVVADSCIYKVQNYNYNLTMLRKYGGVWVFDETELTRCISNTNDYVVTDDKQRQYFLNFCGPLIQVIFDVFLLVFFFFHRKIQFPPNVTECSDSNETQVCQVWDSGATGVSCGQSNRVTAAREYFRQLPSLTLHIRGGTARFGVAAKSFVHVFCNGSGSDAAPSFSHEIVHNFEYHFAWRRAEVCAGPTPPPTTAPPPTTTTAPPPPTSSTTAGTTGSDTTAATSGGDGTSSGGSTEHSTKEHHSGHSVSTAGNETLSEGTTSAVNGTVTVATPGGPEVIDVRLIIVLSVLGALVVIALVVLVSVYLARRRKRLSGYSSLLQKQEPFDRI